MNFEQAISISEDVFSTDIENKTQMFPWMYKSSAESACACCADGTMVSVQEYKIGPNRNYVDGTLIYTVLEGDTDQTTARAYLEIVKKVLYENGEVYLLLNNQKNHLMDAKARREFYEFAR